VASIEFEIAALEAKLLLQGEAAVSICTEFIQNDGSLSLLRNRLLKGKGKDEGCYRQKRECGIRGFRQAGAQAGEIAPRRGFRRRDGQPCACEAAMNKCIECGWLSAAGFKDGSAPAVARKIAEGRDNTEKRVAEFTEKDKMA
jgi:hypothetical protein